MKKIIGILVLVTLLGILVSSVSAEDLKPYDFGDFTLDVPGEKWQYVNAPIEGSSNGNGVFIAHFTLDELKVDTFDEAIEGYMDENTEIIEDGDGLKVFKKPNKYAVIRYGGDELYLIEDKDLNEAKAIANSANLKSNSTNDEDNKKLVSESEAFENLFKMDIPKKSEFQKINEEGNDSYSIISFKDYERNIAVNYIETDDMDALEEQISQMAGLNDGNLTTEDNLTIVETVYGENSVYVFSDGKALEIASSDAKLDTLKEMAKSVEFKE